MLNILLVYSKDEVAEGIIVLPTTYMFFVTIHTCLLKDLKSLNLSITIWNFIAAYPKFDISYWYEDLTKIINE